MTVSKRKTTETKKRELTRAGGADSLWLLCSVMVISKFPPDVVMA